MTNKKRNSAYRAKKWRLVFFVLCAVSLFALPSFAQNTKGDRPISNQEQIKESKARLKTFKKSRKAANSAASRRIPGGSSSSRANHVYPAPNPYPERKFKNTDRPAKPIGPIFNTSPNESRSRAWKGDIRGDKIRTNTEAIRKARKKVNVYPQPSEYKEYLSQKAKKKERPWKGDAQGYAIIKRYPSKPTETKNVFPQYGLSPSNFKAKRKKSTAYQAYSQSGEIKNVFPQEISKKRPKKSKAVLTTASGDAPIRMFPRESERIKKPQDAFGNALSISKPFIIRRKKNVYWGKFSKGEKPITRDLAGLRLRRKNYKSALPPVIPQDKSFTKLPSGNKKVQGNLGLPPSKSNDNAWLGDPNNNPIRKRGPKSKENVGINPGGIAESTSEERIKRNRGFRPTGYLSTSGSKGAAKRLPPSNKIDIGSDFSGRIKSYKPLKGGGSISGTTWNNKNKSITDRLAGNQDEFSRYRGYLKQPKREFGGGSISGKTWNNHQQSITRGLNKADQGFTFTGNIKAKKPEKGGESISGQLWNNQEESITRKRNQAYQGFDFAGDIKATKPKKGGESISGIMWNNKEKPIASVYAQNPRISVATSGRIRQKEYIQHPKAHLASNKKLRPTEGALAVNGFKSKMKQGHYLHKPKAVEVALLGLAPGKSTARASAFEGKIKLSREYVHNPKSAVLALKVLSQPKAYAKIGAYQGNLKMRKAHGKELHPDAKFAHLGESNTKADRTVFTNIKLLWAKMFKKGENQPQAAKPKEHPPRYDRKEKELWKALYDYNEVKK